MIRTKTATNFQNLVSITYAKKGSLKMKTTLRLPLAVATLSFALSAFAADPVIQGRTDKDQYQAGEKIEFTFKVTQDEVPVPEAYIKWIREGDDGVKTQALSKVSSGVPLVVKTSMDKPGFVRVTTRLVDQDGKNVASKEIRFIASAGVEVDKLQGVAEPADFDAFWVAQKKKLAAVAMEPVVREEIASPDAKVKMYKVSIPCAGPRPATGYLVIPVGTGPKSRGARVTFEGYGMGGQGAPRWFSEYEITLSVNAHGFELGRDEDYYAAFSKEIGAGGVGGGYAFNPEQNKDPETTYFNGMMLRDLRALDYVKSLPEWNGKDLMVSGGSQGGLQSLVMAGLDQDVTSCEAGVPWCCDMGGKAELGRIGGWQPQYTSALNYYDPIHHAKRISKTCQVTLSRAGLGDNTCPPSGIAVVYNNLKCPKKIRYVQGSEHMHWGKTPAGTQEFTLEQNN